MATRAEMIAAVDGLTNSPATPRRAEEIRAILREIQNYGYLNNLNHDNNKQIYVVAGVARLDGGSWSLIENATHDSVNVGALTTLGAGGFTVPFSLPNSDTVSKVITFIAGVDETYITNGVLGAGASVSLTDADVYVGGQLSNLKTPDTTWEFWFRIDGTTTSAYGYIQWNGSQFTSILDSGINSLSWNASTGELTINFSGVGVFNNINLSEEYTCPVMPRHTTFGSTSCKLKFDMKKNQRLTNAQLEIASTNVWFFGLLES